MRKLNCVDNEIEEKRQAAYKKISENTAESMLLAKQKAESIISDARKKAEDEHNKILEQAQDEIADMVVAATEKIVLKSGTSESYEQFLAAAERSENNE